MELFSTDPDRPGVFAVGQIAYGVFAFGQMATGVVAIGQVARGVIAVGQGAVGFVAIGQGAIGILYGGAMMGVVGRGFGGVLKVLPKVRLEKFERPKLPPLSSMKQLESMDRGWVLARIRDGALIVDGEEAPLQLTDQAQRQLEEAVKNEANHACITVEATERVRGDQAGYREAVERDRVLVGKRMSSWFEGQPRVHLEGPMTNLPGMCLRLVGLIATVAAWYALAGHDIIALFTE